MAIGEDLHEPAAVHCTDLVGLEKESVQAAAASSGLASELQELAAILIDGVQASQKDGLKVMTLQD